MISGHNLYVWNIQKKIKRKFAHNFPLTTMVSHPSRPLLATGDERGQILLWFISPGTCASGDKSERPTVTNSMHWHAHAVACLLFSLDGNYLLSGGEEAVLVLWHLVSHEKQFLPRLGAPLVSLSISGDAKFYAIGCADKCVRLVNTLSLRVMNSVQGFKYGAPMQRLRVDPRSKCIVLNGRPGTLQFYDVVNDKHYMDVDVVPRNAISRFEDAPVPVVQIDHVTFSRDGSTMVTVDRTEQSSLDDTVSLKFWSFDPVTDSYVMNTRVDNPHRGKVSSLVHHPTQPLVISTAFTNNFKVWTQTTPDDDVTVAGESPVGTWRCRSVGFYRNYSINESCVSCDGSLLAIANGQVVCLWDPLQNVLLRTLSHPPPREHLRRVAFVGSGHLVAASARHLYVWNLLSCSVWYMYRLPVRVEMRRFNLVAHPTEPLFVISLLEEPASLDSSALSSGTYVMVFGTASARPLRMWRLGYPVEAMVFVPAPQRSNKPESRLVVLDSHHHFHFLSMGVRERSPSPPPQPVRSLTPPTTPNSVGATSASAATPSLFVSMYGDELVATVPTPPNVGGAATASVGAGSAGKRDLSHIFTAPSHVIPPPSVLFPRFIESLLQKISSSSSSCSSPLSPSSAAAAVAGISSSPVILS